MNLVLPVLIGYFIGSIPFGYLIVQRLKKQDIRKLGSGNTGVTNVLRIAGTAPALVVLIGDMGKGILAVMIGKWFGTELIGMFAGLASIAGHNWSVFLKFSGGRGVATGAGVFAALAPKVLLITALIWVGTIALTRYVSLGSILGAASVPILMLIFQKSALLIVFSFLAAFFVIYRHRPNIRRLLEGTEYRFGEKPHQ